MTWDESRTSILVDRWSKNVSAKCISEELGVTFDAVLGKARRLRLDPRKAYRGRRKALSINPIVAQLIALRQEAGLSQTQLAERMRRHCQSVNIWEKGRADPSLRNLDVWCHALGVTFVVVPVASPCVDRLRGEGPNG